MRREGVLRAEFWVSATDHDRPVWVPACAGMTKMGQLLAPQPLHALPADLHVLGPGRVARIEFGQPFGDR